MKQGTFGRALPNPSGSQVQPSGSGPFLPPSTITRPSYDTLPSPGHREQAAGFLDGCDIGTGDLETADDRKDIVRPSSSSILGGEVRALSRLEGQLEALRAKRRAWEGAPPSGLTRGRDGTSYVSQTLADACPPAKASRADHREVPHSRPSLRDVFSSSVEETVGRADPFEAHLLQSMLRSSGGRLFDRGGRVGVASGSVSLDGSEGSLEPREEMMPSPSDSSSEVEEDNSDLSREDHDGSILSSSEGTTAGRGTRGHPYDNRKGSDEDGNEQPNEQEEHKRQTSSSHSHHREVGVASDRRPRRGYERTTGIVGQSTGRELTGPRPTGFASDVKAANHALVCIDNAPPIRCIHWIK